MIYLWLIYTLVLVLAIFGVSLHNLRGISDLLVLLFLLPLLPTIFYDLRKYYRTAKRRRLQSSVQFASSILPSPANLTTVAKVEEGVTLDPEISDSNRRLFLRLVGSTSLMVVLMAAFGQKKAQAAFFGSVPGPGTVSVKNSLGDTIDPAESQPTDGYEISEVDDSATPSYYGFVHKSGSWYITKEDNAGAYRYTKGSSNFTTNWSNRASLSYDYFDAVF